MSSESLSLSFSEGSSAGQPPSQTVPQDSEEEAEVSPQVSTLGALFCQRCKKTFKTVRGFKNHRALHIRKDSENGVSVEELQARGLGKAEEVVRDLLEEPTVGDFDEEKKRYLSSLESIIASASIESWVVFLNHVVSKFLPIITSTSKILPQAQYDENMKGLYKLLSNHSDRNEMLSLLKCVVDSENDGILMNVIYRFSVKLFDKLLVEYLKMLQGSESILGNANKDQSLDDDEKQTLYYACGSVIKSFLRKGRRCTQSSVWKSRIHCIQERFLFSEECEYSGYFYELKSWFDKVNRGGLVAVNDKLFQIFLYLEDIVRDLLTSTAVSIKYEWVINEIYKVHNDHILKLWYLLTNGILTDNNSVQFFECLVESYVKFSSNAETELRKRLLENKKDYRTVALRTDLKRN